MKVTTSSTVAPAHNAPLPPPQASAARSSRIAPHSHIKGLGLTAEGYAAADTAGFVGQKLAREVCASMLLQYLWRYAPKQCLYALPTGMYVQ